MIALSAFSRHGGALDAARRAFPDAPEPWLDLSTGINPRPYPLGALQAESWTRLPDDEALAALEGTAAARYAAPPWSEAVAAPGTQAIIQRLPALVGGRDVRVLGRTFAEFERVFSAAGARVATVHAAERLAGADVAVVVNPNNPDGRLLEPAALLQLAGRVGTLVVDEAFVDALPATASLVPALPASRVVILRSFGKIYGLAGLRLGFALVPSSSAAVLRRHLGPWAVSGPAIEVGRRALADAAWLATTSARLAEDGQRLAFLLRNVGATAVGATPLFRLVSHPAAPTLFTALAKRGILVRPFAADATWLRFGLPGGAPDWTRLQTALAAIG